MKRCERPTPCYVVWLADPDRPCDVIVCTRAGREDALIEMRRRNHALAASEPAVAGRKFRFHYVCRERPQEATRRLARQEKERKGVSNAG